MIDEVPARSGPEWKENSTTGANLSGGCETLCRNDDDAVRLRIREP